ncbi:hypothetical protein AB0B45_44715 [Nonomuraea sp. NPDC049152]
MSWLLIGRAPAPVSAIRRIFADITTSPALRLETGRLLIELVNS